MGVNYITLTWSKTPWTHIWIDHMYAYVTLARFSCFGLEGSHARLKRMPRNTRGVSLFARQVRAPICRRKPHIG